EVAERVPLLVEEQEVNLRFMAAQRNKARPTLNHPLLTVAIYPRSLAAAQAPDPPGSQQELRRALWLENLRRIAAAEELLVQAERHPGVMAWFGPQAVVAKVGVEQDSDRQSSAQASPSALVGFLRRLAQSPELEQVKWIFTPGSDPIPPEPLDLQGIPYRLPPEGEVLEVAWKEQVIYSLVPPSVAPSERAAP
ncbi:MAG: hypothetical protein Q6M04_14395, partial [Thermostichus sp. BF3_bins_97]